MPTALLVTRRLGCGGVERSVLTLATHLRAPGWEFLLAPLEAGGELEPEAPAGLPGGPRWPAPVRHAAYALRLTRQLWRLRPRVLVTFCLDSLIATCFVPRPPGTGWIAYVGSDVAHHLELDYAPYRPLLQPLLGLAYRRCPRVVAVSQGLKAALVRRFGLAPERVSVLPNPVDLPRVRAQACQPLDEPPFALAVGRMIPMKGFDLLLRALARVPEARLIILGEGSERPRLESLARRLGLAGRLHMPGNTLNPWRYLRAARVVVVPSRGEGFSNVVVEALACEAALVVTDCPHGPRELVRSGEHALMVPAQDVKALAQALRTLWHENTASMRQRAGQRAQDFAAPQVCRQWVELLSA